MKTSFLMHTLDLLFICLCFFMYLLFMRNDIHFTGLFTSLVNSLLDILFICLCFFMYYFFIICNSLSDERDIVIFWLICNYHHPPLMHFAHAGFFSIKGQIALKCKLLYVGHYLFIILFLSQDTPHIAGQPLVS